MKRALDTNDHDGRPAKRVALDEDIKPYFHPKLFDDKLLAGHTDSYAASTPYLHGVIAPLLADTLLRSVRTEITKNLSFTPKETDIYRIHQSGDLANLDGLPEEALKKLPSLVKLRNALYSSQFRSYLSSITGSGPLSGRKTDMAVNVYTPGSHLLCHDDVIGTRRVSYILYLTDPDVPWKAEWGGALRLYSTRDWDSKDGRQVKVPEHTHTVSIPPAFNRLSFFAVQPGESFHDVEEVFAAPSDVTEGGNDKRIRTAISGWYHIPQAGEDGYDPDAEAKQAERSSLAQLQGKADDYERPQSHWIAHDDDEATNPDTDQNAEKTELNEDDLNFLLKYMNPRYLVPDTVAELSETFTEDSSLRLALFLSDKFAASLKTQLAGEEAASKPTPRDWHIARPPHKHRYLFQQPTPPDEDQSPVAELLNNLLPSIAFKKWLSIATDLKLGSCNVLARRFRRGKDYTLATGYDEPEPRLELCLGITPSPGWGDEDSAEADAEAETAAEGSNNNAEERNEPQTRPGASEPQTDTPNGLDVPQPTSTTTAPTNATQTPDSTIPPPNPGGYELYLAADDPSPTTNTNTNTTTATDDPAIYKSAPDTSDGDEDDSVLFKMPACWNGLSIVLRDRGTLKFVKYVSAAAKGDRWDLVGEWVVEGEVDGSESEMGVGEEEEDVEEAETERGGGSGSGSGSGRESDGDDGNDDVDG
ncbi:MAG: hypothetical protein M1828_002585 [Chrysothrix sp. TS-e1954]|nr:MAG: hypothetical protein M1828_002585 [Chrysothrix sp. TS-e1954]